MDAIETIPEQPLVDPVEGVASPEPISEEAANEAPEDQEQEVSATSEENDAEPEGEKPKKRSTAQDRINALTREKYEAQRQLEAAQRQAAEMQAYLQQQQSTQAPQDNMPTLEQYNYDEAAYTNAVRQWHAAQLNGYQQQVAQQQKMARQQYEAAQQSQFIQQKAAEGRAKYPDFVQKVFDPNLPGLADISPAAHAATMQSEASVDVLYYLANNPQEVFAFHGMNPVQAIRRVAQIEANLAKKPMNAAPPPKPPSKVSGNSGAVKDPSKMSMAEFMAWRNKGGK